MVKGGFPDTAGHMGSMRRFLKTFLQALNADSEGLQQWWNPVIALAGYPLATSVARCGSLIVSLFSIHFILFITARASPITHFKAAIDCAMFSIHLAKSPVCMVNLLLFILGIAPHYH